MVRATLCSALFSSQKHPKKPLSGASSFGGEGGGVACWQRFTSILGSGTWIQDFGFTMLGRGTWV